MNFGITPREWEDFFSEAVTQCKLAESLGFHSIWIEEHHMHPEYLPSPLIAVTALAQHLKSTYVGTNVALLPLYHPLRFAEDTATLHQTVQGKLIVGVGAGYRQIDFENFGIDLDERGGRMDEALQLIRKLWSDEKVDFDGKHFHLKNARLHPRLYKGKPPPIWVGGWKRPAIRRAAALGDRWFPGPVADMPTVEKCIGVYKTELERANKEFNGFPIMRDVYLSRTKPDAIQESKHAFLHMYQEDYSMSGHPLVGRAKMNFEDWATARFIIGNEDDAIEIVDGYRKLGANYLVLRVSIRGLKHEQIMNTIRIFGEQVIPHFIA